MDIPLLSAVNHFGHTVVEISPCILWTGLAGAVMSEVTVERVWRECNGTQPQSCCLH